MIRNYSTLAQIHRPAERAEMAREVRRLSANGLTALDISRALQINLLEVRRMVAVSPDEAVQLHQQAWR